MKIEGRNILLILSILLFLIIILGNASGVCWGSFSYRDNDSVLRNFVERDMLGPEFGEILVWSEGEIVEVKYKRNNFSSYNELLNKFPDCCNVSLVQGFEGVTGFILFLGFGVSMYKLTITYMGTQVTGEVFEGALKGYWERPTEIQFRVYESKCL